MADSLYPPPGYHFPFSYHSDPKHYKITVLDETSWQLKVPYSHNILKDEKVPEGTIKVNYPEFQLPKARQPGFDNPPELVRFINDNFQIKYGIEETVRAIYIDEALNRTHTPDTTVIISEKAQKEKDRAQKIREDELAATYSKSAQKGHIDVHQLDDLADLADEEWKYLKDALQKNAWDPLGEAADAAEDEAEKAAEAVKDLIPDKWDILEQEIILLVGLGLVAFIAAKVL